MNATPNEIIKSAVGGDSMALAKYSIEELRDALYCAKENWYWYTSHQHENTHKANHAITASDKIRKELARREMPSLVMPDLIMEESYPSIELLTVWNEYGYDGIEYQCYLFYSGRKGRYPNAGLKHFISLDNRPSSLADYEDRLKFSNLEKEGILATYAYFVHWFKDDGNFNPNIHEGELQWHKRAE